MTGPHDEPSDAGDDDGEELDELLEPTTDLRTAQEKEAAEPASASDESVDGGVDEECAGVDGVDGGGFAVDEDCDAVDESVDGADGDVDEDDRGGCDA